MHTDKEQHTQKLNIKACKETAFWLASDTQRSKPYSHMHRDTLDGIPNLKQISAIRRKKPRRKYLLIVERWRLEECSGRCTARVLIAETAKMKKWVKLKPSNGQPAAKPEGKSLDSLPGEVARSTGQEVESLKVRRFVSLKVLRKWKRKEEEIFCPSFLWQGSSRFKFHNRTAVISSSHVR